MVEEPAPVRPLVGYRYCFSIRSEGSIEMLLRSSDRRPKLLPQWKTEM